MEKLLEQQELILRQQQEILSAFHRIEDKLDMSNFKTQRQYDELNSRLGINERSTRQIDEQIALANDLRRNELSELKPTLEQLKTLEEFLRLDVATHLNKRLAALAEVVNSNLAEIKNLSANVTENLTQLDLKIDSTQADSDKKNNALAEAVTANGVEIKNLPVNMTESLAQLNFKIDKQIALADDLRRNELSDLKPLLEQLKTLEEFLRLDIATRLMNVAEEEL